MNDKEIKKFLKKKGIKYQSYELNQGTSKKDTSMVKYLRYVLENQLKR